MGSLILAGALGVAIAYFFDPDSGRKRRTEVRDRVASSRDRVGNQVHHMRHRHEDANDHSVAPMAITDVRNDPRDQIQQASA